MGSMENEINKIAKDITWVETLETRNSDDLDFHTLAVWQIKEALEAAYNKGRESVK